MAKELQNCTKTTIPLPVINPSIKAKWRAKQAVHQAIVQSKVTSYTSLVTTIESALVATPNDVNPTEKLIDVTEKKRKAEEELLENPEVESVMTLDKNILTPTLIVLIGRTTTNCKRIEQISTHY